jgi:Xaa-Pro aminopeptidase
MSSTVTTPPGLSFAERDRRWAAVRSLMREHEVDYLLVAGFRAREMYESYIADDYNEGCVVFPLEGDPVVLTWAHLRVMRARDSAARGYPLWVDDYRVATSGTAAATVLRDKGFSENGSRLGIVGLRSAAPTEIFGAIPAGWWMDFSESLPGLKYVDLSEEFSRLMLVKSDEELAQVRYAALAAENACRAIQDVAAAGVGEEVFLAVATEAIYRRGITTRYPSIVMNSGPHTLSWGPPRWTTRGEPPRRLQPGDLLQAELMPTCGNQEIQVQMAVALDPLDELNKRCETAARACYDAGLAALRPGMTFAELVEAMSEPLKEYGCWSYTPLVHSISPHFLIGFTPVNSQSVDLGVRYVDSRPMLPPRAAVLKPGMVLAFEPNACVGDHRVNIGGTVIVTETGCEELNDIPTRVTHR